MYIIERGKDLVDQIKLFIRDIKLLGRDYFQIKLRDVRKRIKFLSLVTWLLPFLLYIGIGVLLIFLFIYLYDQPWTGFGKGVGNNVQSNSPKTLWDWLELIIVPISLSLIAWFFKKSEIKTEKAISLEKNREGELYSFYDYVQNIHFSTDLNDNRTKEMVSVLASARAKVIIGNLDVKRKASFIKFLYEVGFINIDGPIIVFDRPDFSGINLDNNSLFKMTIRGADFSNSSFEFSTLSFSIFSGSCFSKSSFYFAQLQRAYFDWCEVDSADFSHANLEKASLGRLIGKNPNFSNAYLVEAHLIGAYLYKANFQKANMTQSILCRSKFISANFSYTDLSYADFTDANLMYANLKGANLEGTKFVRTIISQRQLNRAKTYEGAIIEDIKPRLGPPMTIKQIDEEKEKFSKEYSEFMDKETKKGAN